MEPGTEGLAEIVKTFGRGVLTEEGALDRAALAQVVFNDEDARMSLNAIIHPRVRHEAQLQREAAPVSSVVVEDIPLLVEGGQQDRFDTVVVVTAPMLSGCGAWSKTVPWSRRRLSVASQRRPRMLSASPPPTSFSTTREPWRSFISRWTNFSSDWSVDPLCL